MSTDATTPARATEPDAPPRPPWWQGRSELLVAALVLGIAGFIAVQTAAIPVPTGTEPPGPRFFPTLVAVFMGAVGLALAVQVVLRPARPAQAAEQAPGADAAEDAPVRIDWRCLGIVVATMTVFIAILQPVGWLLSAALLFFGIAYALGSRRLLFDAVLSLTFSSLIQLAFVAGLGLNLPAGILGGIF
ncbi:tripartite tricarboxylate transporter TctB family protein [Streptomonospora nanhaiensis]|uniref:Tripartite tricarboxylate transporter TctB family protein n=1 Tax=Streptomonospora nanhaiensis TaxID=1323731 RepID=A0ABY6YN22_9ACTN|nr:tripartite tricarboxylate transporter TctB family protein [Streptomonospora nanhaiensis]WAE73757.1 tripartite tricarboxylate transporter TctB family protein [Streptomonospora nanhaiensis]